MATSSTIGESLKELRDIFCRETECFRRLKHFIDVNNDEEFDFRFEQMKIELTRIKAFHDLRRMEIAKSSELLKDQGFMKEINQQIRKVDEWGKYLENLARKRLTVEGLSKLILCFEGKWRKRNERII